MDIFLACQNSVSAIGILIFITPSNLWMNVDIIGTKPSRHVCNYGSLINYVSYNPIVNSRKGMHKIERVPRWEES